MKVVNGLVTGGTLLGLCLSGVSAATAEDAIKLETVVVDSSTITINKQSKTEVSTVSVIDEETIKIIDPQHLNQVLQTIPGVTADVRGGEVAEIHMRGVGQQEFMSEDTGVAIVIDGVPVMQNGGKVRINLEAIEAVKVIKGSASYLYGNTARAGAVIITTKKAKNKNEYSAKVEAGSYGYRDVVATAYKGDDKMAFNINANYRSDDGFWEESSLETKSVNGKLQYYIDDSSDITFAADVTDKYEESIRGNVRGVTEARANPAGVADGHISFTKDNEVSLNKYFVTYQKSLADDSNLMVSAYQYSDLFDYQSTPYDSDADSIEDKHGTQNSEDLTQSGIKSEYRFGAPSTAMMLGLDVGQTDFQDRVDTTATYSATVRGRTSNYYDGEYTDLNSDENKVAIYGELKNSLTNKLTTTLNARYDIQKFDYSVQVNDYDGSVWSLNTAKRDDSFENASYRAGLAYSVNDAAVVFSNISTGFRVPTISQKYWGDFDSSKLNNPDLDVETSINYEIGLRGNTRVADNKLNYEVSLFQIDTQDIISRELGTYNRDSDMNKNVGDARNRGLELSLGSDRAKTVSFNLSYTYLDARYTRHDPFISGSDADADGNDDVYNLVGNDLPRAPKHTLEIMANYKATKQLRFTSELFLRSESYADEENQVQMPGYGFVNLWAGYNTKLNGNTMEYFVKINNVLDNHYFRTAYIIQDRDGDDVLTREDASLFVDPGRVYYAGIKYVF